MTGEGERMLAARRRKFWGVIAGLAGVSAVAGFATGFASGSDALDLQPVIALPAAVKFGAIGLLIAAFSYGTWRFLAVIDEVEIADNLWASTAAYYVYAVLFPAWWALWRLEAVGEPDDWIIFTAALVAGGIAYLWRKWRMR